MLFGSSRFHNVVSTFTNVVKLDVENDKVVSTLSKVVHVNVEIHNVDLMLFNVVHFNVEMHNVVSTLIWHCPTSRRRTNQKTTLKQRWNVCGYESLISYWSWILSFLFTSLADKVISRKTGKREASCYKNLEYDDNPVESHWYILQTTKDKESNLEELQDLLQTWLFKTTLYDRFAKKPFKIFSKFPDISFCLSFNDRRLC